MTVCVIISKMPPKEPSCEFNADGSLRWKIHRPKSTAVNSSQLETWDFYEAPENLSLFAQCARMCSSKPGKPALMQLIGIENLKKESEYARLHVAALIERSHSADLVFEKSLHIDAKKRIFKNPCLSLAQKQSYVLSFVGALEDSRDRAFMERSQKACPTSPDAFEKHLKELYSGDLWDTRIGFCTNQTQKP